MHSWLTKTGFANTRIKSYHSSNQTDSKHKSLNRKSVIRSIKLNGLEEIHGSTTNADSVNTSIQSKFASDSLSIHNSRNSDDYKPISNQFPDKIFSTPIIPKVTKFEPLSPMTVIYNDSPSPLPPLSSVSHPSQEPLLEIFDESIDFNHLLEQWVNEAKSHAFEKRQKNSNSSRRTLVNSQRHCIDDTDSKANIFNFNETIHEVDNTDEMMTTEMDSHINNKNENLEDDDNFYDENGELMTIITGVPGEKGAITVSASDLYLIILQELITLRIDLINKFL